MSAQNRRRLSSRSAEAVRSLRSWPHRSPRLPRRREKIRGRGRRRRRAARRAFPGLRGRRTGEERTTRASRQDARSQVAGRLWRRQGPFRRAREPRRQEAADGAGHPREPRPQSAYRGHRPPPRGRRLHRLRARCAGALGGYPGDEDKARELFPKLDQRRRAPISSPRSARSRPARSATARSAPWASAMAAASSITSRQRAPILPRAFPFLRRRAGRREMSGTSRRPCC